ncbi:MAG: DUF3298 and DUF4163 domain-containing protein [Prevotellaceae bacterium]|jgi:hypothetical protein|nr:DUF3298 and DUF4163 domain-containing protein [Prevotellaceae bacterium]
MIRLSILKQFVVAAIFMTSVFACKTNNKSSLEFKLVTVADSSLNYSNDTTISNVISINYFEATAGDKNSIADSINKDFFEWLGAFFDNDGETLTKDNLKDVVASEIKKFIKEINEEDGYLFDCEACRHTELFVDAEPIYQNGKITSLVYSFYQYSGGAHGAHGITSFNYTKDGTLVTIENLSTNIDELTAIAEQVFINQNGEVKDYWFDDDKFYLPDVFFFTENSIVFYYGIYEIAAYAAGDIYIELNNEEVKHLIDYIN